MVFVFCFGFFRIFFPASDSVFFIHEKHYPNGSLWLDVEVAEYSKQFHRLHATGAVIVRALTVVPRIEVTANNDDLIRKFAAFDFGNYIMRWFIGECFAIHDQFQLKIGIVLKCSA